MLREIFTFLLALIIVINNILTAFIWAYIIVKYFTKWKHFIIAYFFYTEYSSDYTVGETPVPIPNTEVKPYKVDGTIVARLWESRTSLD